MALLSATASFADVGTLAPDAGLATASGGVRDAQDVLFNMSVPGTAHCTGNSSSGYVVRNYVLGDAVNLATLDFTSQGLSAPQVANGSGPTFVSALPKSTGATWFLNPGSASPFLVTGLPQLSLFKLVGLAGITPGSYRLGIACVNTNAGNTIDGNNYWEVPITISNVSATQFSWQTGWVPVSPTLSSPVSGDGGGSVQSVAPASNPGVSALTATIHDNTTLASITQTVPVAVSGSIVLTGLTNGHSYSVTLTATNSVGTATSPSVTISPSAPMTPPISPPAPGPQIQHAASALAQAQRLG